MRLQKRMGVGEILLTSVDNEGTCKGFDYDLVQAYLKKLLYLLLQVVAWEI